jgi:hypothetical protein
MFTFDHKLARRVCAAALAASALIGAARAQTVEAAYRRQLRLRPLATLAANPTQMAWGPDRRLYVMTTGGGVLSYAYDRASGALSDPKVAVSGVGGIGIAFHGAAMYLTVFHGTILKLDDRNGNGVWGEAAAGERRVPIVTGLPTGDHDVDQLQVRGDTLYVGIGRRTINGRRGPLTSGSLDDFGGSGFWAGGDGDTWGDSAYGGTLAWIKNLDAVPDAPGAANVYDEAGVTQALVQTDSRPFTTQDDAKLTVHSAGARNPFGLCLDRRGRLWFTNNFNRTATNADGTSGFGYPKDTPGPDFSRDVQDQLFQASPGADYGYADDNWRGVNPMLTPGAPGYHRVPSTTFDNLFNPGPYTLHDPARPDGLGPSSSADGCGFFYSPLLPRGLYGNIFVTRWNDAITEAPGGGVRHTLRYADLVAVDTRTGTVRRVASGFGHPIAVLSDGGDRLLIADYSASGAGGALYALTALPPHGRPR